MDPGVNGDAHDSRSNSSFKSANEEAVLEGPAHKSDREMSDHGSKSKWQNEETGGSGFFIFFRNEL
jgi:hypothetical protein